MRPLSLTSPLLLALLAAAVTGCAIHQDRTYVAANTLLGDGSTGNSSSSGGIHNNDLDVPADPTTENALNGKWATACVAISSGAYIRITEEFLVNSRVHNEYQEVSTSQDCSAPFVRSRAQGPYTFGTTPNSSLAAMGVATVDLNFDRTYFTPLTSDQQTAYNTASKCGLTGWMAGTERDVTGLNDPANGTNPAKPCGPVKLELTLVKVSGSTLVLGVLVKDGSRSLTLDGSLPFYRTQ